MLGRGSSPPPSSEGSLMGRILRGADDDWGPDESTMQKLRGVTQTLELEGYVDNSDYYSVYIRSEKPAPGPCRGESRKLDSLVEDLHGKRIRVVVEVFDK